MRKIFVLYFTSIILLISDSCLSQTPFTNGQVYDYEVGDIMQTKTDLWWGVSSPDSYTTSTILSKHYSTNMDTIYYVQKVDIYTIYHHVPDSSRFETKIDTLVVSNLNDTIVPVNSSSSCFTLEDSFYKDNCGNNVWYIDPVGDSSCWHHFYEQTWYIEGFGGHYYRKWNETGETRTYTVIYYKKTTDSCGTFVTDVKENRQRNLVLKIYPNPVNDQIHIETEVKLNYFEIFDFSGKMVRSGLLNDSYIDISTLDPAMYVVNFYTDNYKIITRKFTKQ